MDNSRDFILGKLASIDNLPTLPAVAVRLNEELAKADCCTDDVVAILSNDPALSAKILKTVNSPLYAVGGRRESSLKSAITRLGFREVRNLALSTSVFKMFGQLKERLFDRAAFWRHCLASSLAAIEIAAIGAADTRRLRRDELHLAGLVHDLGKIILDAYFADMFEVALRLAMHERLPLFEAERLALGIDHAELGGMMAEKWHLPEVAVASIRHHHEPEAAPEEFRTVVRAVNLANYVVNVQELGVGGDCAAPVFDQAAWSACGMTPADIQRVAVEVAAQEAALDLLV